MGHLQSQMVLICNQLDHLDSRDSKKELSPSQLSEPQQTGQLLTEMLEIFWLLLVCKKTQEPLSFFDFVIKFDLGDTIAMLHRSAHSMKLASLEELAAAVLAEIFPNDETMQGSFRREYD